MMYYEITEDANLDDLEIVAESPLFTGEEDYSYVNLYTPEAVQ